MRLRRLVEARRRKGRKLLFRVLARHRAHLVLQLLGLLPAEALVGTEVAVLGGLEVDRLVELELADNDTGPHVEILADDLDKLLRSLVRGAVRVDVDGERLSNTDGVRQLHERAARELGRDERLGDPAGKVSGRAVDLGEVLAREGTATVGTPATVGVDDDLTASETGVTLGTTDDEEARGLDL